MKFFSYIFRNILRNPIRTILTVGSLAVCLFLLTVLLSFISVQGEVAGSLGDYNRLLTMSSQGFAQKVPIANVNIVGSMEGVARVGDIDPSDKENADKPAVSPFSWYGGKYNNEQIPFAQFGVDPDTIFAIMTEIKVPKDQIQTFRADKAGCVLGRKLAEDKKVKVGDPFPLKGDIYPFNLNLTVRGIYDAPSNRDNRMCLYHWSYLDEGLKRDFQGSGAGNAGTIYVKCKDPKAMTALISRIDAEFKNSNTPTRTQTEEAFAKMFSEMAGDFQVYINFVGVAVTLALLCVCAGSMAMSMRERTTEIAVLKAIGFSNPLVLFLVLAEAVIIAAVGGVVGAIGTKYLFDYVDLAKYTAGFVPFFYVPWRTAILGLVGSVVIGLLSGFLPAVAASRLSVINGLRKVV